MCVCVGGCVVVHVLSSFIPLVEDVSADELQDGPSDHYELVNTVSSENTAASWRQMEQVCEV